MTETLPLAVAFLFGSVVGFALCSFLCLTYIDSLEKLLAASEKINTEAIELLLEIQGTVIKMMEIDRKKKANE